MSSASRSFSYLVFAGLVGLFGWSAVRGEILPQCIQPGRGCPNVNVTFWLYTRDTQDNPKELSVNDIDGIKSSLTDTSKMIEILIHGFTGDRNTTPNGQTRPKYFEAGDFYIISVDYSNLVMSPCYLSGVSNVPIAGECVAQFIQTILDNTPFTRKNIHVVGFSLGGQMLNFISTHLKDGPLDWCTALDPALPLWVKSNLTEKLSAKSCNYVDVVHSNAGFAGKIEACGQIDFYVNGGTLQPMCDWGINDPGNSCAHSSAALYYGSTISTEGPGHWGVKCDFKLSKVFKWEQFCNDSIEVLMGYHVPKEASGVYMVKTGPNGEQLGKIADRPTEKTMMADISDKVSGVYDKVVPEIKIPDVSLSDIINIPKVEMPEFKLPENVKLPESIKVPDMFQNMFQ